MAVTHTWSIDSRLKTKTEGDLSNVVFSCLIRLMSEEVVGGTTYKASTAIPVGLDTSDLDPSSFTAFSDLTEAQVLNWAKAKNDEDANLEDSQGITCAEWEAANERNIAKQKNPPTQTQAAPWA